MGSFVGKVLQEGVIAGVRGALDGASMGKLALKAGSWEDCCAWVMLIKDEVRALAG